MADSNNANETKEKEPITWMLIFTCFLCVFGSSVIFGYSTGVLNSPEEIFRSFYNETYTERFNKKMSDSLLNFLWAFTVSIYLAGGMIGIFSAGYLANRFGRRGAIQLSHILAFAAALFFGIAKPSKRFEMIIVARFLIGLSSGIGGGVVPMYLTESSPKHIRGSLGVLHQLGCTIGILISQILGLEQLLGSEELWPVLLIFSAVPGFIVSFMLPFVPESPRYLLIIKKNEEQAKNALKAFRGEKHDIKNDIAEMQEEQRQMEIEPAWTMRQLLKSKKLRFPLIILAFLQTSQQCSGINVVFYYSTGIFKKAGIPDNYVQYATIGAGAINVAMTTTAVFLMEKAGRRPLLLYGLIGMAISAAFITLGLNLQDIAPGIAIVSFICTLTFVVSFAVGLGPIPLFIGGELFKQGPRPAAMSFTGMLNWLCNFLVGITFPFILDGFKGYTFLPFLVVVAIGAVIVYKYVKETKNKTYEEIAQIYYGKDDTTTVDAEIAQNGIKLEEIPSLENPGFTRDDQ
ncbi:solute carrier family 2, facilitated glucose transporter member 1-like [Xenia sp. Carnegie-2017]|uniref:solute carrier family 2, facilitated glucose transporter member 1-like n=1 Tax=Xenia sp. Carnegie-2017 TaxID=2897299 RepID=UPI001F03E197|nr:solute carrier family 2, facilitated glucose transporter member 1-like [Xenia sp. Carnegie-2017]XP_046863616.1 solute carrier family 2, facilitated glucose transporter member 1-like [Xenia sp. Carnegie-2017]XP_046863617.1 solute carrier family 2, facilitated glucose transporter member 1-like [Xenia sp. Carnegie-2017]